MNGGVTLLFAIASAALLAGTALGQESVTGSSPRVLGTVEHGNTTIVFESANNSDLNLDQFKTWEEFAARNPEIARELGRYPRLLTEHSWIKEHPELDALLSSNPELREAMVRNPGNFVLPPRGSADR